MTRTRLVNVRREQFEVYIGRACPRAKDRRCRVASAWGNPYAAGRRGVKTVEEALEKYERWIRRLLNEEPTADHWRRELLALEGRVLGCWCAPDPCHGQVLVRLIDELKGGA